MSLINNMLKDLEKRDTATRDIPFVGLASIKKTRFPDLSPTALSVIAAFFLSLTVLLIMYQLKKHSTTNLDIPQLTTPISTPITSTSASADQNWLNPVSITGVTLQVKDNITEITFLLNHPALYRLTSDEVQNQITLVIDRSQLQSELPPVNFLSTAIAKISTQNQNDDTKFTLTLAPGASIKYANINNSGEKAELVIALESNRLDSKATANTNPYLADKSIKIPAMQNLLTQQYQSALLSAESGQYQLAIQHLTSLLKIDPTYNDARVSLAALLLDQGSILKAKYVIDEGMNNMPEYVPFIELKARILANEGKSKQALTLLRTASPRIAENPEYHALIAAMYEQNNQFFQAANLYRQLLTLNPSNGSWWFGLGVSLDKLNKGKDATAAYNKAQAEGHLSAESLTYLQNRLQSLQEMIDDKE